MLLRRHLHSQVHLPRINVHARAPKSNYSDGTRTSELAQLRRLDSASTSINTSNTRPAEDGLFDRVQGFYTHVEETENQVNLEVQPHSTNSALARLTRGQLSDGQALTQALSFGNPTLIEDVVKGILRRRDKISIQASTWDLLVQDSVLRVLSLSTLSTVLSTIRPRTVHLSAVTIGKLVQRLLTPNQSENVDQLLSLLYPHVLYHLRHLRRVHSHSVCHTPPDIIQSAFKFLSAFLPINRENAINIFNVLSDTGHIPSEAMVDSSSSQTLEQIISVSLVKASIYWNWKDIAEDIISHLLRSTPTPDPFVIRHTTDCLYTLLISSSPNSLHRCLNLIRLLHPHAPVPDGLIRQFYECAVEVDAPYAAEDLYDFSKNPAILDAHSYPTPQGRALTWLMSYMAEKSKKVYLIRTLASDVVKGRIPIPVDQRARFISIIAERGFASPARALWELYATGKDGPIVHGDSALMLRMTSLFTKLARTIESKLDDTKGDISTAIELRSFVHHIITKYKECHEPWESADHRAMTSYARACFIVGKNTEGLNIFKALMKRLEMPDLYDINVALSAIAEQAPKVAGRMIERMEEHGVSPDAVSLGTVLHHASTQKCTEVVDKMIQRAMGAEKIHSDVKAFGALVRAVVQPEEDDTQEARLLKLKSAWELVRRFIESGTQPSTQLGNYLVSLALQARDASLAFNFWDALLKESAEYDDEWQRRQRNAIVLLTMAQNMRGEISGTYTRMITNQLKKRKS